MRQCRQTSSPGPFVAPISGGGGGSGTPNVAIAGTDALGNPVQSPVLIGTTATKSITLDDSNTNTGQRNTVLGSGNSSAATIGLMCGSQNTDSGTASIVGGQLNDNTGNRQLVVGQFNNAGGDTNIVGGSINTTGSDDSLVVGNSNVTTGSNVGRCLVAGIANTNTNVADSNVNGGANVLNSVQRSNVQGQSNEVTQALMVDLVGIINNVHDVAHATVRGSGHEAKSDYCTTLGIQNPSGFGQLVFGQYAAPDPVPTTNAPVAGQLVENVGWGSNNVLRKSIRTLRDDGQEDVAHSYAVAGTKVVGPQEIGWSSPSGVGTKTAFDTATVTLEQLAERVKALTDALLSHGLIGSGPVSPLLTDYTYILPTSGSFEEYSRSSAEESFKIRLEPTGPTNTFQSVRIAFPNTGAAYTVERVYLMRSGNANTAITEDPATGVVTVSGAPFVVPAGTDENPTWYEIAVSVSVGPVSDFVLLVDVASGSPRSDWGSGPYRGLGWIFGGGEKLTQNLTAGINFAGGESFGAMPPVRVKFEGLSTPVLWLPFVGDSWVYGYGDGPGPWRPYGIEGRLNGRWDAFNQPIAVMGYGRSGYTTDQSLTRLQNLLTNFDCRAACVQFNSLNNVLQSLPDTQCRTDWVGVETAMGTRKILPLVGGGMLDAFAPGWFTAWKANSDWMVARNADTNVDVYDNLVSPTTGVIGGGLAYTDDSHPNAAGYDTWEDDCNANMRSVIAGWGV